MLNQKILKEYLSYDCNSGIFIRLKSGNNKTKVGEAAGNKHSSGYSFIFVNYKSYAAHRLAWLYVYGEFPNECIDHINNDRSDNRINNLREATHSQNNSNVVCKKNNKSGYKGVHYDNTKRKYIAQIGFNKKRIHLGVFDCPIEAHIVYDNKAKELFGKFYNKTDEAKQAINDYFTIKSI